MLHRLLIFFAALLVSCFSWAQFADNNLSNLKLKTTNTPLIANQTAEFLPVKEAFQLATELTDDGTLYLNWRIADGYYLYKHAFQFKLIDGSPQIELSPQLKSGLKTEDEYFGEVEIYYHQTDLELTGLPKKPVTLAITSQGCADAGLCYPPQTEYFEINTDKKSVTPLTTAAKSAQAGPSLKTLVWMSSLALLGGLILNLMPCVFPVLSLKVLGFAHDRQHSQTLHGLAYGAGVVISFIAVALLLISLRNAGQAVGWGFQLQSPWFVALLAYLFFTMGLSLSGLVEFGGNWMNIGGSLTRISGYQGSFFTGVLATVVASPCTAPFMGTALGFAATQSTTTALTIFTSLGIGMALPVILLSCSPALMRLMPKPGPWMDNFKQLLAFPLYATAVWLCWVAGKQTGVNGISAILGGCVLLAFGLWLWNGKTLRRSLAAAAIALALSILSSPLLQERSGKPLTQNNNWINYSPEKLSTLRQQNQAIFLNVTADWCITCLANEKLVLNRQRVKEALSANHIHYMKADWTNHDDNITALLKQFDRNGIPLYVFFPADSNQPPVVLPQILTTDTLIKTFQNISERPLTQ
jgi:thiol:disulfide interchange protein DsbD